MTAEQGADSTSAKGLVVAMQANYAMVGLDQPGPGDRTRLLCTRRTRLAKSGLAICVGDRVRVDGIDWPAGRGAVAAVEPSRYRLERPAVANVSRIVVVASLAEPALDALQLTRFLITAESCGPPVLLVLSKADLVAPDELEAWRRRVFGWGYAAVALAASRGEGLEPLRRRLQQPGIAVLCGPSGVGKSSLLNALVPDLALRVAAVSGRLQRGRHTTRHVELFSIAPQALVADTPGFNRPQLPRKPELLGPLFPEVRQQLARQGPCRFSDCLHLGEPGCAVGTGWERWSLYRQCLQAIEQEEQRTHRGSAGEPDAGLRRRGGGLEPRLSPRLRQPSRRSERQQADRETDIGGSEGGEGETTAAT
ncbi:ribosome small subunit-dependent GTPase A [Cyanobium sp. NIES-981]|uniref:ribosome small subunit-dependent GTPase A n=1 Tax=Cyanobium sp. NIES-981 TaxID=1851505 RepID=UPI0007DD54D2|nr:ribosome small subunit-dependent GTPase A [Cyanobium sp. NIES-981]SBO44094.1 putative ribosome biogenesis GTPase RsgA [Cyanobium sp. NIES-981]